MFHVKSPGEALKLILECCPDVKKEEQIPILDALGRILSRDVVADSDVPGFNRSTVDGFALSARDTFGASESMPAMLLNVGEVIMGQTPDFSVGKGQCAYVPTGGELPKGCDACVMVEYTEQYDDGYVYIHEPSAPGKHVVTRASDIKEGQIVLERGRTLRAQDIGALAASGVAEVYVYSKIKVAVMSTGDELIQPGEKQDGAKMYDVNSPVIASEMRSLPCEPVLCGVVADDYDSLLVAAQKAVSSCDVLVISGGSSVGVADMTSKIIDDLGGPGVFIHGIAVKPGKPTIVGLAGKVPVFGLPGHPVSAYFIFKLFVMPLLRKMCGAGDEKKYGIPAKAASHIPSNHGREEYLPVRVIGADDGYLAQPVMGESGLITTLSSADGYIRIPREKEGIKSGEDVLVYKL